MTTTTDTAVGVRGISLLSSEKQLVCDGADEVSVNDGLKPSPGSCFG